MCHRFSLILAVCAVFLGVCSTFAKLPDTRSWEETTRDFEAYHAQHANDGDRDGRRLKELDPKRAARFLLPFLSKDHPRGLRAKAIGALGWSAFREAIPSLSTIAQDETEEEQIRYQALNPGLCYMRHPEAVRTASIVANDKSLNVRPGAYWVLAHHGTDAAISVLEKRLRIADGAEMRELIYALNFSKHRKAGKIVFDNVDFATLPTSEDFFHAYSLAMDSYRVPEAQQNMLGIACQPGRPLSAFYALRYFGSFPREDVAPLLIAYIEAEKPERNGLYQTVIAFIKSSRISKTSKTRLSEFVTSGKVRKPGPLILD